jgi:hypothetical protein
MPLHTTGKEAHKKELALDDVISIYFGAKFLLGIF